MSARRRIQHNANVRKCAQICAKGAQMGAKGPQEEKYFSLLSGGYAQSQYPKKFAFSIVRRVGAISIL